MPIKDRSRPGVRISVLSDEHASSGTPLDLGDRLIAFTFEDSARKADKVLLQLDNFDLMFFEREELMGGAILEVAWGYAEQMSVPRRMVVKKLKGFTTLTVEGQALSMLMNRQAKTRSWQNVTRADVVRNIAAEHGYAGSLVDVDDTGETFDVISQAAETDARFLRRLAAREEFEFFVDGGGFHFHGRRQDAAPTHVLTWMADPSRGDVLDIQVESNLVRRAGKVTVRGRDPLNRSTVEASATGETTERTTLSEVVEVVDPESGQTSLQTRNATATVHPTAATSAAKAERESDARFRRAERATIKLSLPVVGDPTLTAKTVIELRGASSLLSGKYYVDEVKHVVSSSGYVNQLKVTRDGTGRRALAAREQKAQGGARNTSEPRSNSELTAVEVVDRESGATHLAYRRDGRPIGAGDPEAS